MSNISINNTNNRLLAHSTNSLRSPQQSITSFLDVRKQLYQRDKEISTQYQESLRKSFLNEIAQTQLLHDYLVERIQRKNENTLSNNTPIVKNPHTGTLNHRYKSDTSAVSLQAVQFLNNSSIANTKSAKNKSYQGSEKFFRNYLTLTSNEMFQKSRNVQEDVLKFQTVTPSCSLSIKTHPEENLQQFKQSSQQQYRLRKSPSPLSHSQSNLRLTTQSSDRRHQTSTNALPSVEFQNQQHQELSHFQFACIPEDLSDNRNPSYYFSSEGLRNKQGTVLDRKTNQSNKLLVEQLENNRCLTSYSEKRRHNKEYLPLQNLYYSASDTIVTDPGRFRSQKSEGMLSPPTQPFLYHNSSSKIKNQLQSKRVTTSEDKQSPTDVQTIQHTPQNTHNTQNTQASPSPHWLQTAKNYQPEFSEFMSNLGKKVASLATETSTSKQEFKLDLMQPNGSTRHCWIKMNTYAENHQGVPAGNLTQKLTMPIRAIRRNEKSSQNKNKIASEKHNFNQRNNSGNNQFNNKNINNTPNMAISSLFNDSIRYRPARVVLLVEIYNLENVKTRLNLKYCYLPIPFITPTTLETQENKEFKEFKHIAMKLLRITSHNDIYIYCSDGTAVYSHRQLTQDDQVLFAGNCCTFAGIDGIYASASNITALKATIEKLSEKIGEYNQQYQQELYYHIQAGQGGDEGKGEDTQQNNYLKQQLSSDLIATPNTPGTRMSNTNGITPNGNASNTPYSNKSSSPKTPGSGYRGGQDSKVLKKSQFKDYLQQSGSSTNINNNNNTPSNQQQQQQDQDKSSDGNNNNNTNSKDKQPNLQVKGYLNEVMKYLDLFFSKFDYNWRTDKEKQEVDLYMNQELAQPKHMKKHMLIDFKVKAYDNRKRNVESLKRLNREKFVSEISHVLQAHKLSESDVNSVYLLYRSILNISAMLISLDEIKKEDDFFTKADNVTKITEDNKQFVEKLCDYEAIINWKTFVELLKNISSKTETEKIAMFVEVFDSDNSGTLSLSEIQVLAKMTLEAIIDGERYPLLLSELVKYFTQLLFSSQREEGQTEIPMEKIKKAIMQKKENADLLCFFCGSNTSGTSINGTPVAAQS